MLQGTINPTRMNLLLKREELNSASSGAELLRNKRDVLLNEFFSCLRPLVALRGAFDNQAYEASHSLILSLGWEGKERLDSFSFVVHKTWDLRINYKNLLGIKIPQIILESEGSENEQGFSRADTGLIIEETKGKFQDFLKLALRILPEELKLKRLGNEIKQTTRKVNSLEKFVIPDICSQVKFIQETLEEREREDIFRLKRLKKKLSR